MAHTITKTIILDSQRIGVVHYTFISDNVSGELNQQVILDPVTDFNQIPVGNQSPNNNTNSQVYRQIPSFSVFEMWFNIQQCSAFLQFDGGPTNSQTIWLLNPTTGDAYYNWESFEGIKDRTGLNGTGRIIVTTTGFSGLQPLGDMPLYAPAISLILRVKKFWKPQYITNQPLDRISNQPTPTQGPILPTNPQGNIQP